MTTYTKVLIDDTTTFRDFNNTKINKTTSDYNNVSSAIINLDNERGCNKDLFGIGDDVKVYVDKDPTIVSSHFKFEDDLVDSGSLAGDLSLQISVAFGGYYPFDGDANDESTLHNNGVVTGASLTTDRFGSANNAYDFDGTDDNITISATAQVDNLFKTAGSTGGLLIAVINPTSDGENSLGRILDKSASTAGTDGWVLYLFDESAGYCKIGFIHDFSTAEGQWFSDNAVIKIGATNIISLYYDASNVANNPTMYVNGVIVALTENLTPVGTAEDDSTNDLLIGDAGTSNRCFDGVIDEILFCRTYKTQSSSAFHERIYSVLNNHKLNNFYVNGKIGQCMETLACIADTYGFKVGSYVADDSAQFAISTGAISFWYYPTIDNLNDIVKIWEQSTTNYLAIRQNTAQNLTLLIEENNVVITNLSTLTDSLTMNAWNHVIIQQTGTETEFYINNVKQTLTGTNNTNWTGHLTATYLTVGYANWTGGNYKFDDVRIIKECLNEEQRDQIYNIGTGTENAITGTTPTTLEFRGIVDDITYKGKEQNETMNVKAIDYTTYLKDTTVQPIVYTNEEISVIVKNIIANELIMLTTTNINITSVTLPRIAFNQISVFDALHQLAELADFSFYVDTDLDLHFEEKGSISSGVTLDKTNVLQLNMRISRKEIINKLWVYGDTILTNIVHPFTADGGSVVTLDYKPHNIAVTYSGVEVLGGGVYYMTSTPASGERYLVNYEDKQIIFTSGTEAGDNIPVSGIAGSISYDRNRPIVKYGERADSILSYGPKETIIIDKNIKDPQTVVEFTNNKLNLFSDPLSQITINIDGTISLTPGNTLIVTMPHQNIDSTYDILKVTYNLNNKNMATDQVLNITLNRKLPNVLDTIKDMILAQKRADANEISDTDVYTRLQNAQNNIGINITEWTVSTLAIGSRWYLGSPASKNGWIGSPGSYYVTSGALPSTIIASGVN